MRGRLAARKAGHAGTLDPMATGVLVVGVGKATRLLGHIATSTKRYEATIRLGQATTTDDADGQPVGSPVDATGLAPAAIAAAMAPLTGHIMQTPSAVSAIKVDGRRAYAMVRAGLAVQLNPRGVQVARFEVIKRTLTAPFLDLGVVVDCSTGTYIRALARDLGQALGVGGHLTSLRRTLVGPFTIESAVALDDVTGDAVMPLAKAARAYFASVDVDEQVATDVSFGRAIEVNLPADPTAVFNPAGDLLALYRPSGASRGVPVAVLVSGDGRD